MNFLEPIPCPKCGAPCSITITKQSKRVFVWKKEEGRPGQYVTESFTISDDEIAYQCPQGCGEEGEINAG